MKTLIEEFINNEELAIQFTEEYIKLEFIEELAKILEERKISLEMLAKDINIAYNKIESLFRNDEFSLNLIARICVYLRIIPTINILQDTMGSKGLDHKEG